VKIAELFEAKGSKIVAVKDDKADDEIFKNFHVVKKDGKEIGTIWQTEEGDWAAESLSGASWDMIDSKQGAIDQIVDDLS
jgi:nucleoside diphosphate kinase